VPAGGINVLSRLMPLLLLLLLPALRFIAIVHPAPRCAEALRRRRALQ